VLHIIFEIELWKSLLVMLAWPQHRFVTDVLHFTVVKNSVICITFCICEK
jgi:hypothetical protein